MNWALLRGELAGQGLVLMGLLHEDGETLALIGTGGGSWPRFCASPEYADGAPDPLDRWSKRVLGDLATRLGAVGSVFPSDGPPYPPFIRWALASGRFWSSPVGMLVHDGQGLMFSLRGALRFQGMLPLPDQSGPNPCEACADQPCLTACPVGALSNETPYDVEGCKTHLRAPEGSDCMTGGCLARRACPVSQISPRDPAQSAFHMRAFLQG
ncbi:hypothetical protein [Aestuariivita boseongensis]|uniref:hypothetical protein n=1 Tax=Aestuariivita boseongensis TaxID=1470562 RepID=UPI00067FE261|nr:hypothetical protein [Aestuariivita boseongensis]